MRDEPGSEARGLEDILATTELDKHRRLHYGGRGPRTGLLCGGFALDGGAGHPILRALQPSVLIHGAGGHPVPWVSATLALLSAETTSNAPGADEVVTRLADALLTQTLRTALEQLQRSDGTGLPALRDQQIAAAIELIHGQPERGWTVGELAAEVALSRSTFSSRFRQVVGESPLRYLTRARLAHAAALLRTTDAPLAEVATRAGYGTEFSFGKAFKRMFGIAPGAYRGESDGSPCMQLLAAPNPIEGIVASARRPPA